MFCRTFRICLLLALTLTSIASTKADVVNFTIDSTQSFVDVTLIGIGPERSQTSGAGVLNLTPSTPPFGVAQITDMNVVLDEGLTFNLFGTLVTITTMADDLTVDLVTPGAAGTVSSGQFDQTGNTMQLGGTVDVDDDSGLIGGDQMFNLSALDPSVVDFNGVSLSRAGDVVTISGTYEINEVIDANGTDIPINVAGVFVASGVVVPEPSGMVVLLGSFGFAILRRRRS